MDGKKMMSDSQVRPFLMFEGKAEEAMNLCVSLFPNARVHEIARYGPNQPGPEGSAMKASFAIGDQTVLCTDSFVKQGFSSRPRFRCLSIVRRKSSSKSSSKRYAPERPR
jgi:predicted 3-demethylubiquinone-9 3-methyltransferase (glyoxalase superfamily)